MDTNVMYIEHYIDLHHYINDQFIKLDDKVYTEGINLSDVLFYGGGILAFMTIIDAIIGKSSYFNLNHQYKTIEKFKDNFKELKLTSKQISDIMSNKEYKNMNLKEKDINKLLKELNNIQTEDSLFYNILKNPYDITRTIKTISELTAVCLFFTTSFMKGIVPKGFKDKLFLSIIKLGKEIDKVALDDKYSLVSIINFISNNFNVIGALYSFIVTITPAPFYPLIHAATSFISTTEYIKHKIKTIEEVESTVNRFAQENGLSTELNEYLGKHYKGANLGEAIKESLENMEILLKFIYNYRNFIFIAADIININK